MLPRWWRCTTGNGSPGPNWGRRLTIGLVAIVAAILGYLIAAAVIPRWWAQRVGNVVDGSLTVGALYGLFIGFVFTVAPLLLLLVVWKWRSPDRTWLGWLGWLVLVVLLAAPNLMTLGIVLGISDAAHAGDRTLDVEGPGFRLWTLIGVIARGRRGARRRYLIRSRRASRDRAADDLHDELRTRDQNLNPSRGSYSGTSMGTWLTERRLTQVAARLRSLARGVGDDRRAARPVRRRRRRAVAAGAGVGDCRRRRTSRTRHASTSTRCASIGPTSPARSPS